MNDPGVRFELTPADSNAVHGLDGQGFLITPLYITFLRSVVERPRDWVPAFTVAGMNCRRFGWIAFAPDTLHLTEDGRRALKHGVSPLQPVHLRYLAWFLTPRRARDIAASGTAPRTWAWLFIAEGWLSGKPWEEHNEQPPPEVVITDAGRALLQDVARENGNIPSRAQRVVTATIGLSLTTALVLWIASYFSWNFWVEWIAIWFGGWLLLDVARHAWRGPGR
jgi:hypothetical protein